jgi:chromosome segregation protein
VKSEFDSLSAKKEVLIKDKEEILLMMAEIEAKKKEMFLASFNQLNDNFKEIFQSLSKKGDAFLELLDPENPFNDGMVIKVRLSGDKFMDIRSLSGGEKTMTALAFIFAIQEYAPASFYVLDEVDAALDKRNSDMLGTLIKKYSAKAQYVVISHNDEIISKGDNLYGVSMNEFGISKVVSLKV